nr:MAG TPA: hypothetical protein [Bacteriophage sp.]
MDWRLSSQFIINSIRKQIVIKTKRKTHVHSL